MKDERILVGLDNPEEFWNAFDYAIREAKEKGIDEITVIYSEEYRSGGEILEEAKVRGEKEDMEVKTAQITTLLYPIVFPDKFEFSSF